MARSYVSFDDWSGGDIGRKVPAHNDSRQFRGINCWVYPNEAIAPRPPWQNMSITGLPMLELGSFNFLRSSTYALSRLFFTAGTSVYMASAAFSAAASALVSSTNAAIDSFALGASAYFVSAAGSGFAVDMSTGVKTELGTMPAGIKIDMHGQQPVIAGTAGILYSANLNDPTTWNGVTSGNVPVGDIFRPFRNLMIQRDTVVLPKFNGDIWQVSGVIGSTEFVRQIDQSALHAPATLADGHVVNQSNAWWVGGREAVKFTGAQAVIEELPDIPTQTGFPTKSYFNNPGHICPLLDDDEFLILGVVDSTSSTLSKKVYMTSRRPLDGYTRHLIPITIDDPQAAVRALDSAQSIRTASAAIDGVALLAVTGKAATSSIRCFAFNSRQEFPHLPAGTITSQNVQSVTLSDGESGAPTVASFATTEYWDVSDKSVTVRAVSVDYSYDATITPLATFNKFNISVDALQREDSIGATTSTAQTFTPDGLGSSIGDSHLLRGRVTFYFGDQGPGTGFRVNLTDWRGIMIHKIICTLETAEARH